MFFNENKTLMSYKIEYLFITSPKKLCFWRGIIFIGVYLSVYPSINSKSSWPISMKFGMMMYYDKIQVPFEDEINRVDRTQTSPKKVVKIVITKEVLSDTL